MIIDLESKRKEFDEKMKKAQSEETVKGLLDAYTEFVNKATSDYVEMLKRISNLALFDLKSSVFDCEKFGEDYITKSTLSRINMELDDWQFAWHQFLEHLMFLSDKYQKVRHNDLNEDD